MMGLPIIELTKEQRLRVRVPSAMRAEYERNRSGLFVLVFSAAVLDFSAAVLDLDGCFRRLSSWQTILRLRFRPE